MVQNSADKGSRDWLPLLGFLVVFGGALVGTVIYIHLNFASTAYVSSETCLTQKRAELMWKERKAEEYEKMAANPNIEDGEREKFNELYEEFAKEVRKLTTEIEGEVSCK